MSASTSDLEGAVSAVEKIVVAAGHPLPQSAEQRLAAERLTIARLENAGATITRVYDNERASNVVLFTGSGTNNGYRLRQANGSYWNDTHFKSIEWSMRYSEPFTVYIAAQTTNGFRYLYYTSAATSTLGDSTYVHHGLGATFQDGNWHTVIRNLEQDLLVLRSELENRPAPQNNTAEFDAFRAQVTRNINALTAQVQNLQQQLNAR